MRSGSGLGARTDASFDPDYVPSPCVKVCAIERDSGLCRGCKRSLEEIRAWGGLGPDAKRSLLEELRSR